MKTKVEILRVLRNFKKNAMHKYGILSMGIFGSYARNQQDEASDLDIFVTLREADLFTLEKIKEELEKLLPCVIDIVCFRDSLRNSFKQNILRDAVYI